MTLDQAVRLACQGRNIEGRLAACDALLAAVLRVLALVPPAESKQLVRGSEIRKALEGE